MLASQQEAQTFSEVFLVLPYSAWKATVQASYAAVFGKLLSCFKVGTECISTKPGMRSPCFRERERERESEQERERESESQRVERVERVRQREGERETESELHGLRLGTARKAMKSNPVQIRQITPMGFQPSRTATRSVSPPVVRFAWTLKGKQPASSGHEIGPRISIAFLLGAEDRAGKSPGTEPLKSSNRIQPPYCGHVCRALGIHMALPNLKKLCIRTYIHTYIRTCMHTCPQA